MNGPTDDYEVSLGERVAWHKNRVARLSTDKLLKFSQDSRLEKEIRLVYSQAYKNRTNSS